MTFRVSTRVVYYYYCLLYAEIIITQRRRCPRPEARGDYTRGPVAVVVKVAGA